MIGYKSQDRDYIAYSKELRVACKSYIKDNRLDVKIGETIIIYKDDLLNGQYIKEDENLEKYCIEGIAYSNNLIIDEFEIRKNCEDKNTENEETLE
jgi:hypothetical protein